jgi:hypothetical protein
VLELALFSTATILAQSALMLAELALADETFTKDALFAFVDSVSKVLMRFSTSRAQYAESGAKLFLGKTLFAIS